jgi:hypothetical protein
VLAERGDDWPARAEWWAVAAIGAPAESIARVVVGGKPGREIPCEDRWSTESSFALTFAPFWRSLSMRRNWLFIVAKWRVVQPFCKAQRME